ncbi:CPBP family intramembrane metalloprotease, partial [Mesorhizobium sp. M00.F.Ca.ET.186.01.1.1]
MLTGTGLSLASWAGRQKSTPWAIMLFIGYWLMFAAEFSMIRFHLGEDGKWVASTTDVPEAWMGLVVFAVAALSLVGAIGYMYSFARESKQTLWLWGNHELTGNDVVHIVAWMHVFQTIVLVVYG